MNKFKQSRFQFATLKPHALAGACLLALAACGGGGGGEGGEVPVPEASASVPKPGAPAPAPAPAVPKVCGSPFVASDFLPGQYPEPACVSEVPAAQYPPEDVFRLSAFNRLNEVRKMAGIGLLKQNAFIDLAAQTHSAYLANCEDVTESYEELSNCPYYRANSPESTTTLDGKYRRGRLEVAGYSGEVEVGETMSFFEPNPDRTITGANEIDSLMSIPSTRSGLLKPQMADVGVGFSKSNKPNSIKQYLILNLARTAASTQGASHLPDKMLTWPVANAVDVPTQMSTFASPNPVPDNCSYVKNPATCKTLGYPISVHLNSVFASSGEGRSFKNITADTFKLFEADSGIQVEAKVVAPDYSFHGELIPRQPLKKQTKYKVVFSGDTLEGNLQESGRSRDSVARTWFFTTGNKVTYSDKY